VYHTSWFGIFDKVCNIFGSRLTEEFIMLVWQQ